MRYIPPSPSRLAVGLRRFFAGDGGKWLLKTVEFDHNEGSCLLVAQCLKAILPQSRVVTLLGDRQSYRLPEHYGVAWKGWYFDGNGGFSSAAAWLAAFDKLFPRTPVVLADRYVRYNQISNYSWFRADLVTLLKETLPAGVRA